MRYTTEEMLYGPGLRFNDWKPVEGETQWAGGCVEIQPDTLVERSDYPYGGGGDVETSVSFSVEPVGDDTNPHAAQVVLHFNFVANDPEGRGEEICISHDHIQAKIKGEDVGRCGHRGLGRDVTHTISLATLDERYVIEYNGEELVSGTMRQPFVDNEGKMRIVSGSAIVRLERFAESAIFSEAGFEAWEKTDVLYQEEFDVDRFDALWMNNHDVDAPLPDLLPGKYVFRHMSNYLLRERFDGPLAVEFEARPVPNSEYSAEVTDAIFVWMAHAKGDDLISILEEQTTQGVASLHMLLPYSFYWVDFGGTNNRTTRLRKNPYRHMMRQYTDRARLLKRNHTYRVTCVAMGEQIEFHVDGEPMIRVRDPHPHDSGHVGIRCFVSDLELTNLAVYRIRS